MMRDRSRSKSGGMGGGRRKQTGLDGIPGINFLIILGILGSLSLTPKAHADQYHDCFHDMVVKAFGGAEIQNSSYSMTIQGLGSEPEGSAEVRFYLQGGADTWTRYLSPPDQDATYPVGYDLTFTTSGTVYESTDSEFGSLHMAKNGERSWHFGIQSGATSYRLDAYLHGDLVFTASYPSESDSVFVAMRNIAFGTRPMEIFWTPKRLLALDGTMTQDWEYFIGIHQETLSGISPENQTIVFDQLVIASENQPEGVILAEYMKVSANSGAASVKGVYPTDFVGDSGCTGAASGCACCKVKGYKIPASWHPPMVAPPPPPVDNIFLILMAGICSNQGQDQFPPNGGLDYVNLANNSVRFDMARNLGSSAALKTGSNVFGDSLVFVVAPLREGSRLADHPKMVYKLKPNPLFDPYRSSGFPPEGWVYCDSTIGPSGTTLRHMWNADLPDEGFFFPGDVIHYYLEINEEFDGYTYTYTMPPDTTGFSFSPNPTVRYLQTNVVRALPTMFSATPGDQPPILIWDDGGTMGNESEWDFALMNLGYLEGLDFDVYYTNSPADGLGNGLGGSAALDQLQGYQTIIYTSGDKSVHTVSSGENDAGNDLGLLTSWLELGGKNMLLAGNNLANDLMESGPATQSFLNDWMGMTVEARDVAPLIEHQNTPEVRPVTANPVFTSVSEWRLYGCDICSQMPDAVTTTGTAVSLAEFSNREGDTGAFPYSAGVLNTINSYNDRVISLPYDLKNVMGEYSGAGDPIPARTSMLSDILVFFGHLPSGQPTHVPERPSGRISAYPNPFNPRTTIAFTLSQGSPVDLRVFDMRGRLVRVLLDGKTFQSGHHEMVWDGCDGAGRQVASGPYFYRIQAGDFVQSRMMTMIK